MNRDRIPVRAARAWLGLLTALIVACATGGARTRGTPAGPLHLPPPDLGGLRPARLLLVSVAGLTATYYRESGAEQPAMPALAELARRGIVADAVEGVAPAATYPAHATLVTGERPARHGVPADRRLGDRGVRPARYSHASHLKAPTLWQAAGEAGRRVASLGWPSTVGAAIPQLVPDAEPRRSGQTWLGALADSATPSLVESARRLAGESPDPDLDVPGPARDSLLVELACELLASKPAPEFTLLHLSQTAPALALYGPDTQPARAAFQSADREIARLVECLGGAALLESTALVVVGDHGTAPVHTRILPNAVLVDAGLVTLVEPIRGGGILSWSAVARSNGGSAFVYAGRDRDALLARRALEAEAERTGAFRVVSAEELLAQGADPEAWFGLEAQPGFAFGDAARGELLSPEARRGVGGYLPRNVAMEAAFVAWGRGLRAGLRVPFMRQIDVAPTLAPLLGLELGEVEGHALVGILSLAGPPQEDQP